MAGVFDGVARRALARRQRRLVGVSGAPPGADRSRGAEGAGDSRASHVCAHWCGEPLKGVSDAARASRASVCFALCDLSSRQRDGFCRPSAVTDDEVELMIRNTGQWKAAGREKLIKDLLLACGLPLVHPLPPKTHRLGTFSLTV